MSSTPKPPAGSPIASGAATLLNILAASNGYVTLGIQVAGVLVPLGKALIGKIKSIGAGAVTITFTDLVAADTAELDAISKLSTDELAVINTELAAMGLPTLPEPPKP
jgi:hypothetical protein